jgi:glycosyltransferase involved in cell wall biosynthesis
MKPDLDILVPARNEAKNLPELLLRIKNSFANSDIKYRVLIIDDNSTDGTEKLVSSLSSEYPVVLIKKHGLPGKASAIIQGSQNSEAEIQAMIDADLEYPPEALPQMYKQLVNNNFGVVVGNRANLHNSYLRSLGSKINRFLMGKFLLGFSCDVQSGLKVFRKEIVRHLDPKSIGAWAIDMPLLYTATQLGLSLGSQDIQFTPRTAGESKCKQEFFTASKQIILGALKLRLSSHKIYSIPGTDPETSIGSGLAHKGARFITHSQLHHHESAFNTLMPWQKYFLLSLISFLVFGLLINPLLTGITFIGLLSLLYFFDCLFTLIMIYRSLNRPPQLSFTEEQISQLDNDQLPIYSILCPLYKEAKVLTDFLHHISELDWPKNKLDVILLLESDDSETS